MMRVFERVIGLLVLPLLLSAASVSVRAAVVLEDGKCRVRVEPATLEVMLRCEPFLECLASAAQTNLGPVIVNETNRSSARISFPSRQVSVDFALRTNELIVHVVAAKPGAFTFPVFAESPGVEGWILPMFEGVYAPAGDETWRQFLVKHSPFNTTADFGLPFLGLNLSNCTLACIFSNAFNNEIEFARTSGDRLRASLTHEFTRNHPVKECAVIFRVGRNFLIEPARVYRDWLKERGEFVTLAEKIRRTPEAGKLPGAAHVYLWGNGTLNPGDVKDWKTFASELYAASDATNKSPASHVWALLEPPAGESIREIARGEWADKYQKTKVTDDLNRILALTDFSVAAEWRGLEVPTAVSTLLRTNAFDGGAAELCRLNSQILAAVFPNSLAASDNWGNGVSVKMVRELSATGFDRLWLGSDGWSGLISRPETVRAAKQAGYLIGPYDSFHSIHRPGEPDTWETAQFDEALYRTGGIVKADGTMRRGFKQKGYVLSPSAALPYVEQRVSRLMGLFPANSWFVDCDGFGEFFDDYSEQHPATQQSDLAARNSRMAWIRDTYGAVIGTEGCSAGVASTVHFAHGVMTPVIGWGDPDLTSKESPYYLGAYYPPDEPQVFFKPVPLKEEYRNIYFDPRFRLPLFETVFHDSVVATHHWTWPSLKARDEAKTMELLELLYQVPPLYHLNLAEFNKRKAQLKRHYDFFSPLHRETALMPLTEFQWLVPDGRVQRTVFGDDIEVIANFGSSDFKTGPRSVPKGGVAVTRLKEGTTSIYVP